VGRGIEGGGGGAGGGVERGEDAARLVGREGT